MTRRGLLLTGVLLLVPGIAAARGPARRRARARRSSSPLATAPKPPAARSDLAPVPNHDIVGPRQPEALHPSARIDPVLIDPDEPRFSATIDPNGPQAREDRLLRQPGAGARLRVPFSY